MKAGPAASASPEWRADTVALIGLLTSAYTISFIDRQVLNLLVQPIKADLRLSDTELSLLQGLAFGLAYIVMSPVFGRLADRVSRRNLLIAGLLLWSSATIGCGLARTHGELVAARLAIGGAEACLTPAAWSMISDSFKGKSLPRAFSIYLMGPYLGAGLALVFGGAVLESAARWDIPIQLAPWRLTFIAVGLPGILLALLLCLSREPDRTRRTGEEGSASFGQVLHFIVANRAFYVPFYLGTGFFFVALYAIPAWAPAVMMRRFGVPASQIGLQYGIAVLIAGSAGVLGGPSIARRLDRGRGESRILLLPILCAASLLPLSLGMTLIGDYPQALALFTAAALLYSLPGALTASALQLATPPDMRGVASSLYVLVISIVGLGAAPTLVALITDRIFADELRVGDALAIVCAISAILSLACLRACASALPQRLARNGESKG